MVDKNFCIFLYNRNSIQFKHVNAKLREIVYVSLNNPEEESDCPTPDITGETGVTSSLLQPSWI